MEGVFLSESPEAAVAAGNNDTVQFRVCDNCRVKKTKCDMTRPACGNCQMRHVQCTYSQRRRRPGPLKGSHNRKGKRPFEHADRPGLGNGADNNILSSAPSSSAAANSQMSVYSTVGSERRGSYLSDVSVTRQDVAEIWQLDLKTEQYLFDLYFQHLQPLYPLFRKSTSDVSELNPRLKLAVFSVSARFADPKIALKIPTSAELAKRCENMPETSSLNVDEIKTAFLLCLHDLYISVDWDTLTKPASIVRLCEVYDGLRTGDEVSGCDEEEWRSVWWSVFSLDTACSALAVIAPQTAMNLQERVALPTMSVSEFTNSLPMSLESAAQVELQFLKSSEVKHWETMRMIYERSNCRTRNFYLATCCMMRILCSFERLLLQNPHHFSRAAISELESEFLTSTFSIPSWFNHPARNYAEGETADEHHHRLDSLFLRACIFVKIAIAQARVEVLNHPHDKAVHQRCWQTIMAKSEVVIEVLQNWKPDYFMSVDPICSFIIYLTGMILVLNETVSLDQAGPAQPFSAHVDLLRLFLSQVSRYYAIGAILLESLDEMRTTLPPELTYEKLIIRVWNQTTPMKLLYQRYHVQKQKNVERGGSIPEPRQSSDDSIMTTNTNTTSTTTTTNTTNTTSTTLWHHDYSNSSSSNSNNSSSNSSSNNNNNNSHNNNTNILRFNAPVQQGGEFPITDYVWLDQFVDINEQRLNQQMNLFYKQN